VIEPEMLRLLAEAEGALRLSSASIADHPSASPPTDLPAILRRESLYCAMGRLSRSLSSYGGVDFNAFLSGTGNWLGQPQPLYAL
jgi:hypothetical protein